MKTPTYISYYKQMNHSSPLPKGTKTVCDSGMPCSKSKLQVFRQTPTLSLVAASDVEFSCALISTGVRNPWHVHKQQVEWIKTTQSMVKGHSQDIIPLAPSQALCIWKRYYVVYSYATGDVRLVFVFTSFHL